MQAYQIEILSSAMKRVAANGRLVYSTCSLEPEENEEVIKKTLAVNPEFVLVGCRDELQRLRDSHQLIDENFDRLLNGKFLRTIPGVHSADGFFAAILEKK
jgi:16S rRNA (cytosine967-C5)-methyltransferase